MRSSFLPFARLDLGFPRGALRLERIFSLPLFPGLTESDHGDAIAAVGEVLAEFSR